MVPTALTAFLVATTIALACVVLAGMSWSALAQPGSRRVLFVSGSGVLAWVAIALVLGGVGAFAATSANYIPWIALGIVGPLVAGWRLFRRSAGIRGLVEPIPLAWLIGVQLYRTLGVVFLLAYADGLMPAAFALPAGIGDILVGLAAPIVAVGVARNLPRWRPYAVAWNIAGIADLVLAVTMGFLTSPSPFQQLALEDPNAAITRWPFVLVPTFAVPVAILLHLLALRRLRAED